MIFQLKKFHSILPKKLNTISRQFSFLNNKLYQSSQPLVITEKVHDTLFIGINRPDKRNCVNRETASLLRNAFKEVDQREDIKVGVLHGMGGNFCAGYDLDELSSSDVNDIVSPAPMGPSHMLTRKPMIAAIDGYAVAGGMELALLCDLRVMEENAIMGVFCRRFGVPLIDGGTVRLQKIVGLGRALDLIRTGRGVDGKEALAMGLVTESVGVGTALGRANQLAERLTKFPQECMRVDRRSVYYSAFESKSLQDALDFEFNEGKQVIATESVSGAKAFIESGIGRHGKFNLKNLEELMKKGQPKKKSVLLDDDTQDK